MSSKQAEVIVQLDCACKLDPGLQGVIDTVGYPVPRIRRPGFPTLLEIIVSQQISTKAANAIRSRLEACCQYDITPEKILALCPDRLRQCGLSDRKIRYACDMAAQIQTGHIVLQALETLSLDEIMARLTAIKGIGRWSAEIYAMFALGQIDVFPAGDLALQGAIQRYHDLDIRPTAKQVHEIARQWSPYRTVVALLMWQFYRSISAQR